MNLQVLFGVVFQIKLNIVIYVFSYFVSLPSLGILVLYLNA